MLGSFPVLMVVYILQVLSSLSNLSATKCPSQHTVAKLKVFNCSGQLGDIQHTLNTLISPHQAFSALTTVLILVLILAGNCRLLLSCFQGSTVELQRFSVHPPRVLEALSSKDMR